MKVKEMTKIALVAAIICILAPISIPIGPVPLSLTNLVLYFALYIIGTKNTLISYIIYYLLGIFGLPVFSGFAGGFAKAVGPTGGYLIGFIFLIIIGGFFVHKFKNKFIQVIGMILGTAVTYAFGTAWFCYVASSDVKSALVLCVFPFVIEDIIKMILAAILGERIKNKINL